MGQLFQELTLRGVTVRNRVGVSPMCQYSSIDGFASDWHVTHLSSRAVGGAGLVMVEATAVEARGRISPHDLGIWKDEHIEPLARVARNIEMHGAVAGIQIAHAGRKASTARPWEGGGPLPPDAGAWTPIGASPIPFATNYPAPSEASTADLAELRAAFRAAAVRALAAGFRWLELHGAHGYLLHSFLSPLSNQRTDAYGGSYDRRVRFLIEVVREVRAVWPERLPLAVRLSCTDWVEGGWSSDDSVELGRRLKAEAVDLIDCSSGGSSPLAKVPVAPGYQVELSHAVRRGADIPTAAVGLITEPAQAEAIVAEGRADLVLLARAFLRDPYWALHAAHALGERAPVPPQYLRAF
ncbi:MAG TPA: NADH:flavin oxidoreductase/NADH oxidase [Polyangiaceae bacterium]|nr:NADH:flavin oxidoreductase/NADH oxidase [Polyangiaceae bacterium]